MTAETSANQSTETTPVLTDSPAENTAQHSAPVSPKPVRKRRVKKTVVAETESTTAIDTAPAQETADPASEAETKPAPKKRVRRKKAVTAPKATDAKAETAAADTPSTATPAKKALATRKAKPRVKKATKSKITVKPLVAQPMVARPTGKVAVAVTARAGTPAVRRRAKKVDYQIDEVTGRPLLPEGYKPAENEEYMNPLHQEYFRQRLQQWRVDLVEESRLTIENLRDEVRDIGDEAERATRETENSLELRTRDRYRKLIAKIDSTLKRLDEGDYGYCVDSGEEIGLGRLEVRLTAERTVDAQERWEHLQKQHGE